MVLSAMLERDTGLELSRATLDGWVLRVGVADPDCAYRKLRLILQSAFNNVTCLVFVTSRQ
jgi:hypothetical protein